MRLNSKALVVRTAMVLTFFLILMVLYISLAVPLVITPRLVNYYDAFTNDWVTTNFMFESPVLLTLSLLAIILILLRRIQTDQILSSATNKWVKAFTAIAGLLALHFVLIGIWASSKNSLHQPTTFILILMFIISLAISLVSGSLLGLLKKATAANEELEGVV